MSDDDVFMQAALRSRELFAPVRFDLPKENLAVIRGFRDHLETKPGSVAHLLGAKEGKRDWLEALKEQFLGEVVEGLAAVRWHLAQIALCEADIKEIARKHEEELFPNGAMALSFHCRPIHFEYQAFVVAVRRTLEYVAGMIGMYFKTEANRIRTIGKSIDGRDPEDAGVRVQKRLDEADVEAVIGTGDEKSVRDRLVHYEAIDAGTLNIRHTQDGELIVFLVGGGEGLHSEPSDDTEDLSVVLAERVEWLESLVVGILEDLDLLP